MKNNIKTHFIFRDVRRSQNATVTYTLISNFDNKFLHSSNYSICMLEVTSSFRPWKHGSCDGHVCTTNSMVQAGMALTVTVFFLVAIQERYRTVHGFASRKECQAMHRIPEKKWNRKRSSLQFVASSDEMMSHFLSSSNFASRNNIQVVRFLMC